VSGNFGRDVSIPTGIEAHAIHLVDRHRHLTHAQQMQEVAVAAGLIAYTLRGIDDQQGGIGLRGAGDHVAEELGVSGRVDQHDVARGSAQTDLAGIDGDALIALGLQRIEQKRPFERHAAAGTHRLERVELALGQAVRFVQETTDQGRLAVIDMADDDDAHQRTRGERQDGVEGAGNPNVHDLVFGVTAGGGEPI
jgi:hypothetical protein